MRGEVHRPRASQRGHLYFELVEKGRGDRIVGKLDGVLWRTDHQRVRRELARSGQELTEGQEIRCFGQLDVYPPSGRLQLVVRQVDPLFSLGEMERRRRETLRALEREGLLETNAALALPELPLRLGLVTSKDSAAYHDFLTGLRSRQGGAQGSGPYGFRVLFAHAAMQGPQAEREVASALGLLARLSERGPALDALVLVRGGGSRSDLAAFDSRGIAEAVAKSTLPVICGLGHEIDRAIADVVCHTSLKTPTEAASFFVDRVRDAEERVLEAERDLTDAARRVLGEAERRLQRMDRIAQHGRHALEAARRQVSAAARSVGLLARRRLRESEDGLERRGAQLPHLVRRNLLRAGDGRAEVARRLAQTARGHLRRHDSVLDGLERLLHGLSPERILERGYSITRVLPGAHPADGSADLLTRVDQVRSGDRLETRVAAGTVFSTVTDPVTEPDPEEESREGAR